MKTSFNQNKVGGAILSISSVVILLVILDFLLGGASAWLYHHAKYGIFHRQQYVLNESKDDIIIMGSSRASHHYVPSIISDSLGLTCYNAGSEGMCIYYHYALFSSLIERGHLPKLIILDIVNVDLKKHPGPTFTLEAALERLSPHYGEYKNIDSLFELKGWKYKLKLKSFAYRYNSKLVQSIKCNYIPSPEDNGYESVLGHIPDSISNNNSGYAYCEIDALKLSYVRKFIALAKENDVNMVLVISPMYKGEYSYAFDVIRELSERNNIPFIDCFRDSLMMKRDYFRDSQHLNDYGAHIWSSHISHLIKNLGIIY